MQNELYITGLLTSLLQIPVYPVISPSDAELPLVIYTMSAGEETVSYDGEGGFRDETYTIRVVAKKYSETVFYRDKIRAILANSTQLSYVNDSETDYYDTIEYPGLYVKEVIFSGTFPAPYINVSELSSSYDGSGSVNLWVLHAATASFMQGSIESSSYSKYAETASYVDYENVSNKPTIVSASSQIDYNDVQNKPTSISSSSFSIFSALAATASFFALPLGTVSGSSQIDYATISNAPSSIPTASYVAWSGIAAAPTLYSGSAQVVSSLANQRLSLADLTASVIRVTSLYVNTITSSIDYASGSNVFGTKATDLHQFTGSVAVSGSLFATTNFGFSDTNFSRPAAGQLHNVNAQDAVTMLSAWNTSAGTLAAAGFGTWNGTVGLNAITYGRSHGSMPNESRIYTNGAYPLRLGANSLATLSLLPDSTASFSGTVMVNSTNVGTSLSDLSGRVYTDGVILENCFVGENVSRNTAGNYNFAGGTQALQYRTSGSGNTAVGRTAGREITTGGYNSFFGMSSGRGIISGSNNTIIGANVSGLAAGLTDNIILATGQGTVRAKFDGPFAEWILSSNYMSLSPANGSAIFSLKGSAGTNREISFKTGAINRWGIRANGAAESTGNVGSDFVIEPNDDAGATMGAALTINRATKVATFGGTISVSPTAGIAAVQLQAATGSATSFMFYNASTPRFGWVCNGSGVTFALDRYNDSGSWVDAPISVNRSTGAVTIPNSLTVSGSNVGGTLLTITAKINTDTANDNEHFGYNAKPPAFTGNQTVTVGSAAGNNLTSGVNNTFIGRATGLGITTGSYNTILGANVTGLNSGLSNNIILATGQGTVRQKYNGADWLMYSNLYVNPGAAHSQLGIQSNVGYNKEVVYYTAASRRWSAGASGTSEPGSDVGTDYNITAYNDSGSSLGVALSIVRATKAVAVNGPSLSVAPTSGYAQLSLKPQVGSDGTVLYTSGTTNRFGLTSKGDGLSFVLDRFNDSGSWVDAPISVSRASGLVTATAVKVEGTFAVGSTAGTNRGMQIMSSGLNRWFLYGDSVAESGANAGTDLRLVAYDDAAGVLGTALAITRSTGQWNITGPVRVNPRSGNSEIGINGPAATLRQVQFTTNTTPRWNLYSDQDAESGANAGSTLKLARFSDAGANIGNVFIVNRASGLTTFPSAVALSSSISVGGGATILAVLTATAVLDFASLAAGASQSLTIALTGATLGQSVSIGLPNNITAGIIYQAYVNAADSVTILATNVTAAAIDPASGTFRVTIIKF